MLMPALTVPLMNGDTVAARRRLGRGLSLPFQVAGQAGELRLEPGHGRKLAPKVVHDRVELALPLIDRPKVKKAMGGQA